MQQALTACAVVFVSDVRKVRAFYIEIAGMSLQSEDAGHAVLEIPGFELVIHKLRGEPPAEVGSDGRVLVREDSYWKICLPVPSIAAARELAPTLGGFIKPARNEWEARGFRACDGNDPEGNVIQVRELA